MTYSASADDYRTPTRSSKQAHSYFPHQPYSNQRCKVNPGNSSNDQKSPKPPLQLLPKISSNLFSLISRFEALDSLSTPFKSPSLQPGPPKHSMNSQRSRNITPALHTRRLSTVFSPSRKSRIRNGEPLSLVSLILSGDAEDDVFNSTSNRTADSSGKVEPGKLRLANPWYKVGNDLKSQPNSQHRGRPSPKADPITIEQVGEVAKEFRRSIVKDNIRLYDGSKDAIVPTWRPYFHRSSSAHDIPAERQPDHNLKTWRSSHSLLNLATPTSSKQNGYKKFVLQSPAPATSEIKVVSTNVSTSATSRASAQRSISKNQKMLFSDSMRNLFMTQKQRSGRTVKSTSFHVSPKTAVSPRDDTNLSPSDRLRLIRENTAANGTIPISVNTKEKCCPPEDGIIENRIPTAVRPRPTGFIQRKISEKIEALYSAKSMEKKHEYICIMSQEKAQGPPHHDRRRINNLKPANSTPACGIRRRISKVSDMRQLFDGKQDDHLDVQHKALSQTKLLCGESSVLKNGLQRFCKPSSVHFGPSPSQSMPPKCTPASGSSIMQVRMMAAAKKVSNEERAFSSKFDAAQSHAKKWAIGERTRLFEGSTPIEVTGEKQIRISNLPKKLTDSIRQRKMALGKPSKGASSAKFERGLSGKDIQAIVHEFQHIENQTQVKKQNIAQGNQRGLPICTSARGAMIGTGAGLDGASINAGEMIVKEADCGLKEPKPMRLVEMKRMIWLCRERSGPPLYSERSRVLHSKRV